jgi:hypothetical protein
MLICPYYLAQMWAVNFSSLGAPPVGGIMLGKASIVELLCFEGPTNTNFSCFLPVSMGFHVS